MIGSNLLDLANIIFFLTSLPQIRSAYLNRSNLDAVSYWMLSGYLVATLIFAVANASFNAYIAGVLNVVCAFVYGIQIYWKIKK